MQGTKRLQKLSESATLAMAKKVRALKAAGKDVIGLTLGEPDFDTPAHIGQAGIQAIHDGHTHYPPVAGIPDLRAAVAEKYQCEYGLDYTAANVVVSTGGKQSLVNVIMALVDPGERAILLAPYWVSYIEMLKMADAEIDVIETTVEQQYKVSPEQLAAVIQPTTRLIILNNPSNPTGATYTRDELAALVEVLAQHPDLYIISDEIYEYLTYDVEMTCLATFESIRDRVIIINGVSKAYAMTGWRIGFTVAPQWIAALCEKYQGQITSGASNISQHAALEAVRGTQEPVGVMRDDFRKRRDYVYGVLNGIEGVQTPLPEGAFYFYPDFSGLFGKQTPGGTVISDIDVLCNYLIEEALVAVITGRAFGTEKHVRISYAYSMEMLQEAMARIEKALSALV